MENLKKPRSVATKEKIYQALTYLLKRKKFSEIYVKDLCAVACIHRSSFYEYYQDINDLMIKTEEELSKGIAAIFQGVQMFGAECFVRLFSYIKEHGDFYYAYLNSGETQSMGQTDFTRYLKLAETARTINDVQFHMAFFAGGLQAVCKVWLNSGMQKTPEEMAEIIFNEYRQNAKFFQNKTE